MSADDQPALLPDILYYMVAYGSLPDGITFFGPFTQENAERFKATLRDGAGEVIPLTEARIMSARHGFHPMGLHGYEVRPPTWSWPTGEELEEYLYVTLANQFYDSFSALIAAVLQQAPENRRDDLLAKLGDMSSVYGSDYKRYL